MSSLSQLWNQSFLQGTPNPFRREWGLEAKTGTLSRLPVLGAAAQRFSQGRVRQSTQERTHATRLPTLLPASPTTWVP